MRHRPFQVCVSLTLGLYMGLATPLAVLAETDWYTLKSNGQVIGKVGIHSYPAQGDQAGTITEVSNVNHFTREGSPFEVNAVSRFIESPEGNQPLSFTYNYDLGEQRLLEAQGHLINNALDLRLLRENTESIGKAPVSKEQFLFPGGEGIKQVYRQHYADRQGAQFSYQTLHLGVQPQVINTEVTSLEREKLALATGESKPVRKYELTNPANRDKKIYEWRDAQGKLYKSKSVGTDGMEMVYASQRQIRDVDQNTVDLVTSSAVISNAIPQPRITNEALYKISPLTGQTSHLEALFPQGFSQRILPSKAGDVETLNSDSVYLKTQQREPANALATFPIDFDSQYLQATPYLQVSDPQLDQTALAIVGKENRAYYAARQLQQWVYKNIAYKDLNLGFASAKETFQRRQGDCTEHAVLLASLLRSLGIPSRVAIGLIYLPDQDSDLGKFVFHMWTEAYIGNRDQGDWIPLDATNPEPLPDATHIKIADSALNDTSDLTRLTEQVVTLMGKIRLDVVKAVSPSQSVLSVEKKSGITALEIPRIDINRIDIQALSRQAIKHFRIDLPPASLSADSANGLFTSGLEAQAQGKSVQAGRYFAQSLGKVRHPVELYQMGERLLAVGQYGLARQAFTQAKTKDDTLTPLVANWMSAGIPEAELLPQQAALFEQAVARQYQVVNGFEENACELFQNLTRQGVGNFFPAYRGVGETCSGPEAVQAFRQALAINPDDFQSMTGLGDWYMNQQQYSAASQSYLEAIQSIQGKPFAESRPWVEELTGKLEIANGAARLGNNKKNAEGWLHIGKGLSLQHRYAEAAQAFQNVLILQPGNTEATIRRFEIALNQADWDYLKSHAGNLSNNNATAAHLLAQYQMRNRQYSIALANAQKAIALAPHQGEAYETLSQIYSRMASQAAWQKPPQGANNVKLYLSRIEAALKQGIEKSTKQQTKNQLALKLGTFLISRNRSPEAETYANLVLETDPLNGRAHWLKGKALLYAGHNVPARNALKTALILLPNDPDVLAGLGQIAEGEGQDALALDYYQKAYKADGSHYIATQLLRAMMSKLQVSGKKPHNFMPINADEHDYLVQFVRLSTAMQKSTLAINKAQLEFFGTSYGYNLQHIESMKKNIELMRKAYDAQLGIYRQVEALNTPPRFIPMKYTFLQMQHHVLESINESISLNGFVSESQFDKARADMEERHQRLAGLYEQGRQSLMKMLSRLSETEIRGIVSESGWEKRIVSETKLVQQELLQRKEENENKAFVEKTGQKGASISGPNTEGSYKPSSQQGTPKQDTSAKPPATGQLQSPTKSMVVPSRS